MWQGIHDPGQTQEKDWGRGFILLPHQPAVLPRSETVLPRSVIELSLHLLSSSKTVRPIFPRGSQSVDHVELMW